MAKNRKSENSSSHTASREFRDRANRVGRDIRDGAATVGEDLRGLKDAAGDVVHEQFDPLERTIRERPLSSVLAACGIGMILGWLFKR